MLKIKEWKYTDMTQKMSKFGDMVMNLNPERTDDEIRMVKVDEDGYVHEKSRYEVIKETEKAVQIRIDDMWTEWFPKTAVIY